MVGETSVQKKTWSDEATVQKDQSAAGTWKSQTE